MRFQQRAGSRIHTSEQLSWRSAITSDKTQQMPLVPPWNQWPVLIPWPSIHAFFLTHVQGRPAWNYPGKRLGGLTAAKEALRLAVFCMVLRLSTSLRNDRQGLSCHFGFSSLGGNKGRRQQAGRVWTVSHRKSGWTEWKVPLVFEPGRSIFERATAFPGQSSGLGLKDLSRLAWSLQDLGGRAVVRKARFWTRSKDWGCCCFKHHWAFGSEMMHYLYGNFINGINIYNFMVHKFVQP